MEKLDKIDGEFSEPILNEAGIPSKSEDSRKVQNAHKTWKEAVKERRCENAAHLSYWQKIRTSNML